MYAESSIQLLTIPTRRLLPCWLDQILIPNQNHSLLYPIARSFFFLTFTISHITTKCEKWKDEKQETHESKRIILTEEGSKVSEEVMRRLPLPYKKIALTVKKRLYPKTPEQVRHLVHKEFPQYKDSYVKNDIE